MMQKQERMRKMAVTTVTKDNFEAVVLQAEKPVLIDFYATCIAKECNFRFAGTGRKVKKSKKR